MPSSFVSGSTIGPSSNGVVSTMGMHPSMSTVVSPPTVSVPAVRSNFYYSGSHINAYSYGPPYYQDPLLTLGPFISPYHMIPSNHVPSLLLVYMTLFHKIFYCKVVRYHLVLCWHLPRFLMPRLVVRFLPLLL
jgi:hypothetical protein